jgi:hypothetical protein
VPVTRKAPRRVRRHGYRDACGEVTSPGSRRPPWHVEESWAITAPLARPRAATPDMFALVRLWQGNALRSREYARYVPDQTRVHGVLHQRGVDGS